MKTVWTFIKPAPLFFGAIGAASLLLVALLGATNTPVVVVPGHELPLGQLVEVPEHVEWVPDPLHRTSTNPEGRIVFAEVISRQSGHEMYQICTNFIPSGLPRVYTNEARWVNVERPPSLPRLIMPSRFGKQ